MMVALILVLKSAELLKQRSQSHYLKNSGVEKACNVGIMEAAGDYIVRVDADDYISEKLSKSIEKFLGERLSIF